ncbi:hypothetical protein HYH03_006934 [Edaphochlamys debaryana]|uniref:ADP-ribosylhydrolase ARH3 n=1 Tax=Edaphochlamys debaryana TaxID=47281 RepID=A0A835Y2Z7_9CHLO|nr:hypothetical protein HYH03_006934 [Edaphochlamys debaryana]|eukprot:KAG2495001.1 hypothetical protein HYH03_006934 [Edaphochlamys debaryana]
MQAQLRAPSGAGSWQQARSARRARADCRASAGLSSRAPAPLPAFSPASDASPSPRCSSPASSSAPLPSVRAPAPSLRRGPAPPASSAPTAPVAPAAPAPAPALTPGGSTESRAVGMLLGAMCGNVLGAPHQDERQYQVVSVRRTGVTDFWKYDFGPDAVPYGEYTGEMCNLLAVAASLVACNGAHPDALREAIVGSYSPETRRYSPYDKIVAEAVLQGVDPADVPELAERYLAEATRRHASTASDRAEREPYGPSDLCAAARAAPIGYAYRSAPHDQLLTAVRASLEFSHATPLGLDAAAVVAAAVGWAARQQAGEPGAEGAGEGGEGAEGGCGPEALLAFLTEHVAVTTDMRGKLALLKDGLFQVGPVTDWRSFYAGPAWARLAGLFSRLSFHGYATVGSEFAAVALLAFLSSWGRPEQAVIIAASFGGHAPATAQVVGALGGALYGDGWLPDRWLDELENGEEAGRDAVAKLARELAAVEVAKGLATREE